ncbi:YcgL domain-containing protein [Methylomarinum sp. Ch1-1]|uniref:YcgL domain-containing protein Q9L42_002690 n=1 Tax=Methylomarinum roseum TaxID=3067653 RepID=A0AAU7NVR4_9GAMM
MQCYIYKSLVKDELYLYLNKKDDFSDIPEALFKSFGRLQFVMELELTADRKLAREDVNKVMTSLSNKGFFVQMPPTVLPDALAVQNSKLH